MLGWESFICSFVPRENMHLRRSSFPHEESRGKVKVKVFLTSGDLYIILLKNKYIENERKNIRINNLACTLKKNKRNKFWNNGLHKPFGCSTKKFTMEQISNCSNPAKFAVIPQVWLEDLTQIETSCPSRTHPAGSRPHHNNSTGSPSGCAGLTYRDDTSS